MNDWGVPVGSRWIDTCTVFSRGRVAIFVGGSRFRCRFGRAEAARLTRKDS